MAIDIRQFFQTFFEETLDGLENMESELLHVEKIAAEHKGDNLFNLVSEPLNTIFRVVHSIKGGSSTFGFSALSDFSHVLETLLDELREQNLVLNREITGLLLQGADCMKDMIVDLRTGSTTDVDKIKHVQTSLERFLKDGKKRKDTQGAMVKEKNAADSWMIEFKPNKEIFHSGNDPVHILRELATLGDIEIHCNTDLLPEFDNIDPEQCHLGWSVILRTNANHDQLREVFSWVIDACDLNIKAINSNSDKNRNHETQSIRVSIPKVDVLVDLVGELVITQTMLNQISGNITVENISRLQNGMSQLERNIRDLQEAILSVRMLPIKTAYSRLPRMVRDLSEQLGKKVELKISGEQTELDKTVIDSISDPLMHLVRNCIDHGIEKPDSRKAMGKAETGIINIDSYQQGGDVIIEIKDDGSGLHYEKILNKAKKHGLITDDSELSAEDIGELIFLPGFTTTKVVSDVSGRGVGMDVVRNNIRSLGGNIKIASKQGEGICFHINLPLTLAIVDGLSVLVSGKTYILPLISIIESIALNEDQVHQPAGGPEIFNMRNEYIPIIRLNEFFNHAMENSNDTQGILVIIENNGKKAGLYVDDLLGQQQVVIKSLNDKFSNVDGISAATVLGDGTVALILDVSELVYQAHRGIGNKNKLEYSPSMTNTKIHKENILRG